MGLTLSQATKDQLSKVSKTPVLVMCLEDHDRCYGSATLFELIRIGDPGLFIDGTWVIGGKRAIGDQSELLSMKDSTNSLKTVLDVDKGRGSTITNMEIGLVDFDNEASELISPGVVLEDVLGRKALVYLGFEGVPFSEFDLIFRGNIDDIKTSPGLVKLNIAAPDNKKRQLIMPHTDTIITAAINAVQTTGIFLENADELIIPNADTSFETYVRIEDELIRYTGITGLELTGVSRAQLGTVANSHDDESNVASFYRLTGNAMRLALKLMLSGPNEFYKTGLDITNFVSIPGLDPNYQAIYFDGLDIKEIYGLEVGDVVSTTGAGDAANNFSNRTVTGVTLTESGSYIEVDGAPLVLEADSPATIDLKSQFNTLPDKVGLQMSPDEVDVAEHLRIEQLFLSSFEYDFYIKETIENANEFIEQEIYKPASAYSLPRKARSSVGYLSQPIPSIDTVTIAEKDVVKPQNLVLRRSTAKAFFNHIVYAYEEDTLEDKFLRGRVVRDATSTNRIKVGTKALTVVSKGMRDILNGFQNAGIASDRRIKRYRFGAEMFENVELTLEKGFSVEIGDVVIFNPENLQVTNTLDGSRNKPSRLYAVENKSFNITTGAITVALTDTGYDTQARYCLYGPASKIKVGISNTKFVIEPLGRPNFGANEWQRWSRFPLVAVKVRSDDFTTRFFQTIITNIAGNTITVRDDMGFTPVAGDVIELANYDFADTTDQIKLLYGFMRDSAFGDGKPQYQML